MYHTGMGMPTPKNIDVLGFEAPVDATNRVLFKETAPYGTLAHKVNEVWQRFRQSTREAEKSFIAKELFNILTPCFYRVMQKANVHEHWREEALSDVRLAFSLALKNYESSKRAATRSFFRYVLSTAHAEILNQRKRRMEIEFVRSTDLTFGAALFMADHPKFMPQSSVEEHKECVSLSSGNIIEECRKDPASDSIFDEAENRVVITQALLFAMKSTATCASSKRAFYLHYVEGMTAVEVGEAMGEPGAPVHRQQVARWIAYSLREMRRAVIDGRNVGVYA